MNRSVLQLSLAQALMMSVNSLMVTTASIIGAHLSDNPALASLPLALQFVAVTATTIPASLLMGAIGRRAGFLLASVIGISGAVCGSIAIYLESFPLFCLGTLGTGIYTAFGHYFRFAAIEVAAPEKKATALSYVLAGGIAAAVIGPNLAHLGKDLFALTYLGSLLAVVLLYGINSINFLLIRLPAPLPRNLRQNTRPMLAILAQPAFAAAVVSATVGYSVMVLLMTATPLAMLHEQHHFGDVAFVIQWHVLGMFVPSFFTGQLINRFGVQRIILCGVAMMLVCVAINFSGSSVSHFWIALLALGVGWNFMFIGGTSLLASSYRVEESAKAQAFNDFIVFSVAAVSSLSAGALLHWLSWQRVNFAALPVLMLAVLAQLWLWSSRRSSARSISP